ncbi:MAG: DUF2493 domain-containing protein [Ruminococcus flavefaciens]|nr:DUF2493 domain-containing protein [Ruminococcus flavefaciens]
MMRRVIVCGGRDFGDETLLTTSLDEILAEYDSFEIVTGGAKGADSIGDKYAIEHGMQRIVFPAKWDKFGKTAGYIRNAQMLQYAQEETPVVVAFWDGKSRGTKHMIDIATTGGAEVHIVRY